MGARQLGAYQLQQQIVERVKPLGAIDQLAQRERGAGAERFPPDGLMREAHGLVRKPEYHLVVPDDATQPQLGDAPAIDIQRLGNFARRTRHFRLALEMLFENFHVGKWRDPAQ